MKARLYLLGASYCPERVRVMLQAFDAAWASVHFQFYGSPDTFEAARLMLADAILLAARDNSRTAEQLEAAGLASIVAHYRLEPGDTDMEAIMPQRINNPRYWQSYAEETATIAEQMRDPECRRMLMAVSATYAELARRASAEESTATCNKVAAKT
jgi:hypothetical protein